MWFADRFAPALSWRAFFVCALASVMTLLRPSDSLAAQPAVARPDAAEASRILEQFRQAGLPGEYYFDFELRALPRRGEERVFRGQLWGSRNEQGAISRIELTDAEGREHRLLLQNGARPAVWRCAEGRVTQLGIAALFAPLIPGVEVTAFDLQMPFLYWPDARLESINRIRGRPAHAFLFRAPAEFTAKHGDVTAARAYLDTQVNALMQYELIGGNGKVLKTFSLLSLKTLDKQPLPKAIDFRNEVTRDKTRLVVTGAALNLQLPPALFQPATLGEDGRPPAPEKIVRLDP